MFFLKIVLLIILLLCLRFAWSYIMLVTAKHNTKETFNKLFEKLKEYVLKIQCLLEEIKDNEKVNSDTVNETEDFITKLLSFSFEKDGNERIIGYANAIYLNMEKLLPVIKETEAFSKYTDFTKEFEQEKEKYNSTAKKLQHYVDVFPSSFIARLKGIKYFDYIR